MGVWEVVGGSVRGGEKGIREGGGGGGSTGTLPYTCDAFENVGKYCEKYYRAR